MAEFAESAAGIRLLFQRLAKDEEAACRSAELGLSQSLIEIVWALADLAAFNDASDQ